MRCADGTERELTVGCRLDPHTPTQVKTIDRKSARELLCWGVGGENKALMEKKLLKLYLQDIQLNDFLSFSFLVIHV